MKVDRDRIYHAVMRLEDEELIQAADAEVEDWDAPEHIKQRTRGDIEEAARYLDRRMVLAADARRRLRTFLFTKRTREPAGTRRRR
jgi:hypothetical protein